MAQPPAVSPGSDPERERISLSEAGGPLDRLREPPTYVQFIGGRMLGWLLAVICGLAAVFLGVWVMTRPSLAQVKALLGPFADPKAVLEALQDLRRDHFDHFSSLFQLLVLSGLVPLFTLLAGYAFGTRERERKPDANGDTEEPT